MSATGVAPLLQRLQPLLAAVLDASKAPDPQVVQRTGGVLLEVLGNCTRAKPVKAREVGSVLRATGTLLERFQGAFRGPTRLAACSHLVHLLQQPLELPGSLMALATSTLGSMWDAALAAAPAGQEPGHGTGAAGAAEGEGMTDSTAAGLVAGLLQEGLIDMLLDLERLLFRFLSQQVGGSALATGQPAQNLPLFSELLAAAAAPPSQEGGPGDDAGLKDTQELLVVVEDMSAWTVLAKCALCLLSHHLGHQQQRLGPALALAVAAAVAQCCLVADAGLQEAAFLAASLLTGEQDCGVVEQLLRPVLGLLSAAGGGVDIGGGEHTASWHAAAAACLRCCWATLQQLEVAGLYAQDIATSVVALLQSPGAVQHWAAWLEVMQQLLASCPEVSASILLDMPLCLMPANSSSSQEASLQLAGVWAAALGGLLQGSCVDGGTGGWMAAWLQLEPGMAGCLSAATPPAAAGSMSADPGSAAAAAAAAADTSGGNKAGKGSKAAAAAAGKAGNKRKGRGVSPVKKKTKTLTQSHIEGALTHQLGRRNTDLAAAAALLDPVHSSSSSSLAGTPRTPSTAAGAAAAPGISTSTTAARVTVTIRGLGRQALLDADVPAAAPLLQGLQAIGPHITISSSIGGSSSSSSKLCSEEHLLEASKALACCNTLLTGLLQGSSLIGPEVAPGVAAVTCSCWLLALRWSKALLGSQGPLSSLTSSSSKGRGAASAGLDKGLQERVLCQAASTLVLASAASAAVAARAPMWAQVLQVLWQAGHSTVQDMADACEAPHIAHPLLRPLALHLHLAAAVCSLLLPAPASSSSTKRQASGASGALQRLTAAVQEACYNPSSTAGAVAAANCLPLAAAVQVMFSSNPGAPGQQRVGSRSSSSSGMAGFGQGSGGGAPEEDLAIQLAGSFSHLVNELWTKGQSNLAGSDMDVDGAAAGQGAGDGQGHVPSGVAALHVALLQACASAPHVFSVSSSGQVTGLLCGLVLQGALPLSQATLVACAAQPAHQPQVEQQQQRQQQQQEVEQQLLRQLAQGWVQPYGGAAASVALTPFGLSCTPPLTSLQPLLQPLMQACPQGSSDSPNGGLTNSSSILTTCLQLVAAACRAASLAPSQWLSNSQQLLLTAVRCLQLPQAALQQHAVALVPLLLQPVVAMQLAPPAPGRAGGDGSDAACQQQAVAAAGCKLVEQMEVMLQQAGPQSQSGLTQAHGEKPTLQLVTGVIQGLALLCMTLEEQDGAPGNGTVGGGGTSCLDSVCLPALGCTAAAAYEAGAAVRGSMSREAAAGGGGSSSSSGGPTHDELMARALLLLIRMLASDETRVTAVANAALTAVAAAVGEGVPQLVLGRPLVLHGLSRLLQQPGGPEVMQQVESQLQLSEAEVAKALLPSCLVTLCRHQATAALAWVAAALQLPLYALLSNHADRVLGALMWVEPAGGYNAWQAWAERELLGTDVEDGCAAVVQETKPYIAIQLLLLSGMPCFWGNPPGSPPSGTLVARAQHLLARLAGQVGEGEEPGTVAQLLEGRALALLLQDMAAVLCDTSNNTGMASTGSPAAPGAATGDKEDVVSKLQRLRALCVLISIMDSALPGHVLQLLALLKEATACSKAVSLQRQAVVAWLVLVQHIAAKAPQLLNRVAAQAAATLLPVLQPRPLHPAIAAAAGSSSGTKQPTSSSSSEPDQGAQDLAARVLHELLVKQQKHVAGALSGIPPLPRLEGLKEVNAVLDKARSKQPLLSQLVAGLTHDSLAVRAATLHQLREALSRGGPKGLLGERLEALGAREAGDAAVLASEDGAQVPPGAQLLSALLHCCPDVPPGNPIIQDMKLTCAECLGLLGALDPASVAPPVPPSPVVQGRSVNFLVELLVQHLVRVLGTSIVVRCSEYTCVALQQLLQHYTASKLAALDANAVAANARAGVSKEDPAHGLFGLLPPDVQPLVRPFLTTQFKLLPAAAGGGEAGEGAAGARVFGSPNINTHRRWLHAWIKTLVAAAGGPLAPAYAAVRPVVMYDATLCNWLLPQLVLDVVGGGGAPLAAVQQEMLAVMQHAAGPLQEHHEQAPLYLQTLFSVLDALRDWAAQQRQVAEATAARAVTSTAGAGAKPGSKDADSAAVRLPAEVAHVEALLKAVPMDVMAGAAYKCGAYARALQCYETYVRQVHGGGLNPAAVPASGAVAYQYGEVSFLLEVYSGLEEPDGLTGLVQLRPGGLTTADQILVAERAGEWGEALALYHTALGQEGAAKAAMGSAGAAGGLLVGSEGFEGMGGGGGGGVAGGQLSAPGLGQQLISWMTQAAAAAAAAGGGQGQLEGGPLRVLSCAPSEAVAAAAAAGVALADRGLGLSLTQQGHLRALLQAGHLHTLLRQVDGLMARCCAAPCSAADGSIQAAVHQLGVVGVAAAWRAGSWQLLRGYLRLVDDLDRLPGGAVYTPEEEWEVCFGAVLDALSRGDGPVLSMRLATSRRALVDLLPALASDSYGRAYPSLLKLHMLQEIQDAAGLMHQVPPPGRLARIRALQWPLRLSLTSPSLSTRGPLLALRRQLAGLLGDSDWVGQAWLQHAKLCRITGHKGAAETAVLEALSRRVPGATLERCRLLWASDRGHRAVQELGSAVSRWEEAPTEEEQVSEDAHGRAKQVLQLATWMASQGGAGHAELAGYYEEALALDPDMEAAHAAYAAYLDTAASDAKQRAARKVGAKGTDRLGGRCRLQVATTDHLDLLAQVLTQYGEAAACGAKQVRQALARLLTLYMEFGSDIAAKGGRLTTKDKTTLAQVQATMNRLVRSIPPTKWLLVLPQLTSRVTHPLPEAQQVVMALLIAIAEAYPQQALWGLAAVAKSSNRARQEAAASVMLEAKKRCGEEAKRVFEAFPRFQEQLIRVCHWQPPSGRQASSRVSAKKEFPRLVALLPSEVQVPSQELFRVVLPPGMPTLPGHVPVTAQPTIAGLQDTVQIMVSLMKPKKLTFLGSDGKEYGFLAKPKDDLRKDYRLMDFVGVLNDLLGRELASRRRGLALRTYAVLPLAEECGILQWVNGLVAFKGACEEVYGAERLYKRSVTPVQIKKMYDSFGGTNRAALLDKVLGMLPPRSHRWLLGRFPSPSAWLAARTAWARSNAGWAMTGHMLGLGDRHGENLMINTVTGETMHVDFGCLFDRGLTLEVPEVVPFRMTQNVVDMCGVSGVEGVLRCTAEIVLQVLRQHKGALMTSAETFLADPLVEWTKGSSSRSDEQGAPAAQDALATIEGRLSGTLAGVASTPCLQLSVEGQVAALLAEAMNHENLGRMYIWWMPWF